MTRLRHERKPRLPSHGHCRNRLEQTDQKQPQNGGQARDQQQSASREQTPEQARAQNGAAGEQQKEKSTFRKAMDAVLNGNAGDQPKHKEATEPKAEPKSEPKSAASGHGISEKEQANEQMLRSVPDDASGLLRARIRQYYARIR